MKKLIPYARQQIDETDIQAVVRVLRSDFLTQGTAVPRFEDAVSRYCGVKYAVAYSSGTAALHGACFAAGINKDDEVITSPLTFTASANCVLYCGGKPILADIRSDLPLIDVSQIAKKITKKTKAIIPVDFSGIPADYDDINQLARKHGLIVIADSAHSLGATYKGKKVGTLADMTVFSFHPVKLITTGEGGMVVTNDRDFYEKLLLFRTHGITKDPQKLLNKNVGPWYYEMQELGFNYRLTDIQAALGISQMEKIEIFIERRTEIARKYIAAFKNEKHFKTLKFLKDRTSAWHLFPVLLTPRLVDYKRQIVEDLHKRGILVQIHYIPVHLHPYYRNTFGYTNRNYPKAEMWYHSEISLPLFPALTKEEIKYIVTTVLEEMQKYTVKLQT